MTDSTAQRDIEFVAPMEVTLTIDGNELKITPLVLRELPNLLAISMRLFAALKQLDAGFIERAKQGALTADEVSTLLMSVVINGDDYIEVLALCSRQPATWVGGLLPDRAAELAVVCLQVNADFFSRAMPILRSMASQLGVGAAAETGRSLATPPSAMQTASSSS